jgi:phosphate-selective porin OprO and OprP
LLPRRRKRHRYLSYFLTGELKPYDRKLGHFGQMEPLSNFSYPLKDDKPACCGWGAWLIGYRYSTVDLDSGVVQGVVVGAHIIGLNWYLNPNTRFMLNYVLADVSKNQNGVSEGLMQVFEIRCHIDF